MKANRNLLLLFLFILTTSLYAQKVPMTHGVYDGWKSIGKTELSNNGQWIVYEVYPQVGDGWLHFYNVKNSSHDSIFRGTNPFISNSSNMVVYTIKQPYDTIRKLKLAKTKKDDLPKDSLGIKILSKNLNYAYGGLKSFNIPKEGGDWVAWLWQQPKDKPNEKDKAKTDSVKNVSVKPATKDDKKKKGAFSDVETYKLTVFNPATSQKYEADNVTEMSFAKNGNTLSYVTLKKSSIDTSALYVLDTKSGKPSKIFEKTGLIKKVETDNAGKQVAFLYTADTAKVKRYGLYFWQTDKPVVLIADTASAQMFKNWEVSENGKIFFADDNTKLYFGTAPKIMPAPKDTLLDEEKTRVDIWSWTDTRLQPQQLKELDDDMKKSYLAVYYPQNNKWMQIADTVMSNVRLYNKNNADFAMGNIEKEYAMQSSHEGAYYKDVYFIDLKNNTRKLLLSKQPEYADVSNTGKYLLFYNRADTSWNIMNTSTKAVTHLTKNIKTPFYNELNDVPDFPNSYGVAGWTKNDEEVLIYDRYDIWKFNTHSGQATNITQNGRANKIIYRYVNTNPDAVVIPNNQQILLQFIDENIQQQGFAYINLKKTGWLKEMMRSTNEYREISKAKDAPLYTWRRSSYTEYPDLWQSDTMFKNSKRISFANPQQSKYIWGNVEMVSWKSYDGEMLKGLLYTPENLDVNKKYPMIVYFYERNSDRYNTYYTPAPTRSIVNIPYYNSNGYIIFVPDIDYRVGEPGQSAYEDIVSGTRAMMQRAYVDSTRMALQGQSWGGYQTAYLITRTHMYKAAMAGAPVSNMTSAYGGIRWESGLVRQFQYERGQSRIGKTLWNNRESYIQNSPLFFADKVNTPLLIMANDNDGAVPWYQGIEYFTALRRLGKPVWMLNYNGDEHNLVKRPNRQDLSIRMSQFFDYYLKDKPMPEWMKTGLPATKKGKVTAY